MAARVARRLPRRRPGSGPIVAQQHNVTVTYDGTIVGEYAVDLMVEATIIVELQAIKAPDSARTAQWLNYPKATGLHLCLLLNFGKSRLEIHRIAHGLCSRTVYLHC